MNRSEKRMLLEIHSLIDSVPNFKNNMDTGAYGSFRADSLQIQDYLKSMTYALLMYADKSEDGVYWREQFTEASNDAREFIEHRKKENWCSHSTYKYTIAISGW